MLNPPDLSGFDLKDLSAGLLLLTQRQHRCLKWANRIAAADGNPGLAADIDNLDRDAATAAKAHRLVSELRRSTANRGDGGPRVRRGQPRLETPPPGSRLSPFGRVLSWLGRVEVEPAARDAASSDHHPPHTGASA